MQLIFSTPLCAGILGLGMVLMPLVGMAQESARSGGRVVPSIAMPPYLVRIQQRDMTDYDPIIEDAAKYYVLPAALIKAVIAVESGFEPSATSPKGAQGLMQLMPSTAMLMQVRDPLDAWENIFGGARYLRILANRFGGDLRHTLAAYNAGPEAIDRYGGLPPYQETKRYVRHVLTLYQHYLGIPGEE